MRYFKRYEYDMWRVHAFEDDSSADPFIPDDAVPISEEEAKQLSQQPSSETLLRAMEAGREALGGRSLSRYPTKEIKEAIGRICVNSAYIEVTLRTLIWHVAGVSSEVGMTLTGGKLRLEDLADMLLALLKLRAPQFVDAAKNIKSRITMLNGKRGQFVHGIWSPNSEGNPSVGKPFLKRSHSEGKFQDVTLEEMYEVAEGYMQIEAELTSQILIPLLPEPTPSQSNVGKQN
ncbi:hypothetical protein GH865_01860 [Rhodocyclus tenuis]|uniref:hypothetical protein n=1 Tax=Rhodocyclus gracilis TaxID=2929842 RepID=UPI001298CD89|nr:hypothetical protein [Rhodocyclus gracilis]MRD71999.1 hypothetical protein [Rhodocyclus gracilis]